MITDKWLTRLFAFTVSGLAIITTVTACILFFREVPVPDPLDRLVTFLLGALVGRVTGSRSPEASDAPVTTTIQNQDPPDNSGVAPTLL